MRVLALFLIFYVFSSSEQKPLDEKDRATTDAVATATLINSDLNESTENSTSVLKDNAELKNQKNSVPTTADTLIVNTDETNTLRAPASMEQTKKSVNGNNGTETSEKQNQTNSTPGKKADQDSTNPGIKGDETLTTSIPSSSELEKVADIVITDIIADVVEAEYDEALAVIPVEGFLPTVNPSPTNATDSSVADNIASKNVSSTRLAVSDDTVKTSSDSTPSSLHHEQSATVKGDQGSGSLVPPSSNSSELLVAVETSSNGLPESTQSSPNKSETREAEKSVKDLNATETTSSTTSDSEESVNATEITLLEIVTEDISNNTDSETDNDSTEASNLEKEILGAEQLIQDLLDPTIVLAKRSLRNPGGIDDSNQRQESSKLGELEAADYARELSAVRARRNAWGEDSYGGWDNSQKSWNSGWNNNKRRIYENQDDYQERRYNVEDRRSDSNAPPFKLIPVFSG